MLCLILTPHEEESLNTSKEASKKDQRSTWLEKKKNKPKQTLHSLVDISANNIGSFAKEMLGLEN